VLDETDFPDIAVTVGHPFGNVELPLADWISRGPGLRPGVDIIGVRRVSTGEPVDASELPLQYTNSPEARHLKRDGRLPNPWAHDTPEEAVLACVTSDSRITHVEYGKEGSARVTIMGPSGDALLVNCESWADGKWVVVGT
jgi:hypothetical protein